MTTELTTTGSAALTACRDATNDVKLVARDAAEMRAAQGQMAEWFRGKLEITRRDRDEMQQCVESGEKAGMNTRALKRQATNLSRRCEFYEKCLIAAENGYCLVPNMNADTFALRTDKRRPSKRNESKWTHSAGREQPTERLPAGSGDYVRDEPATASITVDEHQKDGTVVERTYHFADEWMDMEFPISVAKPEVMDRTVEAMALKVFDRLEVLPGRAAKGDPIVLGVIRHPMSTTWDTSKDLHFLIAWYIDTATLP